MSNYNKWKEFCSQQDTCESCKYNGCDCEIEFWKDWARADERSHIVGILFGIDRQVAELVKEILNNEKAHK